MVVIEKAAQAERSSMRDTPIPAWLRAVGVTVGEAVGVLEPGSTKRVETQDCLPACGSCYCEGCCCIDPVCGYICCCYCTSCCG